MTLPVHTRIETKVVRREKFVCLSHREVAEVIASFVWTKHGIEVQDTGLRFELDGPGTHPSVKLYWIEDEPESDVGGESIEEKMP